jgi:hypothetical protein
MTNVVARNKRSRRPGSDWVRESSRGKSLAKDGRGGRSRQAAKGLDATPEYTAALSIRCT